MYQNLSYKISLQSTNSKEENSTLLTETIIEEKNSLKQNCFIVKAKDNNSDSDQETNTFFFDLESFKPEKAATSELRTFSQ
ncbi:4561_t:CDS:2 [Scutellospora calospora]|uniref:4561_t:CDS:1 n=1 Tax=Scutellospora calospora TaxID=85575 RepID=A0ACA9K679_9GLOM|nr:4561_t:CDS:2 [Scutellospora calospora]